MKTDIVGDKAGSRFDLFRDPGTGDIYVMPRKGIGVPQPTYVRLGPEGPVDFAPESPPEEIPPIE